MYINGHYYAIATDRALFEEVCFNNSLCYMDDGQQGYNDVVKLFGFHTSHK